MDREKKLWIDNNVVDRSSLRIVWMGKHFDHDEQIIVLQHVPLKTTNQIIIYNQIIPDRITIMKRRQFGQEQFL